jgi:hypothetical protein
MTTVLICVFGLTAAHPGTPRVHVLTASERRQVEAFPVDDSCDSDACAEQELARARAMRTSICKGAFGKVPDLSWFETRETTKGGRS